MHFLSQHFLEKLLNICTTFGLKPDQRRHRHESKQEQRVQCGKKRVKQRQNKYKLTVFYDEFNGSNLQEFKRQFICFGFFSKWVATRFSEASFLSVTSHQDVEEQKQS